MRIPIGTTHTATLEVSKWSSRICDHCGNQFFYIVTREGTGSSTNLLWLNKERAISSSELEARENAYNSLMNADAIYSCPNCGYYPEIIAKDKFKKDKLSRIRSIIFLLILEALPIYGIVYGLIFKSSFISYVGISGSIIILFGFFIIVNVKPIKNINENADSRKNKKFSNSSPVLSREEFENNNQF